MIYHLSSYPPFLRGGYTGSYYTYPYDIYGIRGGANPYQSYRGVVSPVPVKTEAPQDKDAVSPLGAFAIGAGILLFILFLVVLLYFLLRKSGKYVSMDDRHYLNLRGL